MRLLSISAALIIGLFASLPAAAHERWGEQPAPGAMRQADQSGYAPVNGIEMYYATYGAKNQAAADPILLIHGGLGHADVWSAQVADLSKDHLVIVADSRGHGRS